MLQIGILQIVTPAEKKRNRNPLSLNWFDRRYAAKSQHGDYYQNQAGVVVTNEKAVRLHKHAKTSADFARRSIQYLHENSNNLELNGNDNNYVGSFKDRRVAIKYLFMQVFGALDEEDWHEMKLVPAISHLLNISKNSHTTVLNTLHKIVASDIEYLGKVSLGQGRVALIQHGTEQSTIVCNALEQGLSSKETACLLNMYRERQEIPEEAVSRSAVQGFMQRHRQLCCMGDTNKGNRYENKVVGDSPEICRGLDAYGFADFRRFIERMRALTSSYEMSNPKRFSFGTPTQVWDSMVRCWTMEPKSDRIIQDIEDFGNVLELIIHHKGSVVPECRLRHGHRQLSHNGGRVLKRKITNRQRKYLLTMGSIHPDAEDALEKLLTIGPTEGVLALAEIEEALGIEEEAFANIIDAEHDEEDDIPDDFDDFDEVP